MSIFSEYANRQVVVYGQNMQMTKLMRLIGIAKLIWDCRLHTLQSLQKAAYAAVRLYGVDWLIILLTNGLNMLSVRK